MIKLTLTKDQFAVIWELLLHVRLGRDNRYSRAISKLIKDVETDGVQDLVNELDPVLLSVEFNDSEGIVLNVKEEE